MSDESPKPALLKLILSVFGTAVITSTLSYAVAESRMCSEVREDNIKIKVQMIAAQNDINMANNRIDRVASLLEKMIGQEAELMTLLRVQNQMKQP